MIVGKFQVREKSISFITISAAKPSKLHVTFIVRYRLAGDNVNQFLQRDNFRGKPWHKGQPPTDADCALYFGFLTSAYRTFHQVK